MNVACREGKNLGWQDLSVKKAAQGRHPFAGRTATTEVRIQVRDKAGNRADAILSYGEKAEQPTGTIKLFSPTLPEPKDEVWTKFGLRVAPAVSAAVTMVDPILRGGLEVTDLRRDSPAARAGIISGDILVGLGPYETVTTENVSWLANDQDLSKRASIKFFVIRHGQIHRGEMFVGE
jgi:membrane-associated protease RseP (regulator of RpoE activity)